MAEKSLPQAPHHVVPPVTTEALDFADLAIIDLSKYDTLSGKMALVEDVRTAMTTIGFFYIINHGYTTEQTRRMFDIAEVPFTVSKEEQKCYAAKIKETGYYHGYKPRQHWHIDGGVRDEVDLYNIHTDPYMKEHPQALRPFLPEVHDFARHNYFKILLPVLRLLAIGLELPEEAITEKHQFMEPSEESSVRMLKYYPRSADKEELTRNIWMKGHTDVGSITMLWSQPVSGLQIRVPGGDWKWVKHIENAVVINAGDSVEILSGGYYKATIHRVHQPPQDQRDFDRLGLFFFALFKDDVKLVPMQESPVLLRVGIHAKYKGNIAVTMGTYRNARISSYGQTDKKSNEDYEEVVELGVINRYYT